MQKYQIISAIGEGAYGVVLKCKDIESNSLVAIKKFKQTDEQAHMKKTTIRQVKLLKMAIHPNIVELKEAFRKKGIVYLVFQYLENNLLQVLQKSPKGLPLPFIRSIIFQLLKGLAYLHQQNIVHRDVKPENLLVSRDQRLKICDFGFARQIGNQNQQEELTDYVATRWYRPPQLLVGGQYDKQIDLWAVGCIMCELIDGNPLFPGENQLDQLYLIQKSMGALPNQLSERFTKNKRFFGMKFPQIQNLDKIQKRYLGKICSKGLALINSLLKMDPKERISAAEALKHPFFSQEKQTQPQVNQTDRGQVYTAASSRKKQTQPSIGFTQKLKYGKIYNKRAKGLDTVCQIYQSSNNSTKSLIKPQKKQSQIKEYSLQKRRNIQLLTKTEARGFYFDSMEQKLSGYGDLSKKSTDIGSVQSNKQLPFLIYNQQTCGSDSFVKNDKTCGPSKDKNTAKKKGSLLQRQTFNIKQMMSHK